MSIRTYNFVVFMATLVAGMALAGVFALTAADRDRAILEVNALELGGERLAALAQRLDVILTAADLALGSGETYSANWASEQAFDLKDDFASLDGSRLADYVDTPTVIDRLDALHRTMDIRAAATTAQLAAYDDLSRAVIDAMIAANANLSSAIEQQKRRATLLSDRAVQLQITSAVLFAVLSMLLSWFAVRLVVTPLERIQRASELEDSRLLSKQAFDRAPTEIRSLAFSLQTYLGQLTETVASRTWELERQRNDLEQEVIRRRLAEADLKEALIRAEAASAAKSAFLSITSHELRTPLTTMIATLELIKQEAPNSEQLKYCELALKAGDLLGRLLRDILDVSAADAGSLKVVAKPVNLPAFIDEVLEQATLITEAAGLNLEHDIQANLPDTVLIDPDRVRQVINNFIANAVKYADDKPLHLRVAEQTDNDSRWLQVAVTDQGPGISSQDQARIFEPFMQVDSSLARREGGVGLGLALSRDLARAMGGECTVVSEVNEGARFELTLPLRLPADNGLRAILEKTEGGMQRTAKVLLVEDSEVNQMLAQALLEKMGHVVSVASDGYQACEICANEAFGVILMDLQMPGIDGLEATSRIKSTEGPNQSTPVVALSANVGQDFKEAGVAVGMVGFVEKPINPQLLSEEILTALKGAG